MRKYLLIESRDPFASCDTEFVAETAIALKERGGEVTVFLIQNGVLAARKQARGTSLRHLVEAGVSLLADDFSLQERGIQTQERDAEIVASDIGTLVDLLVQENTKAIWH